MKIDKKKLVFSSMIIVVLIFIVSYTMLVFMGDEEPETLQQTEVPAIKEVQETYESKLEAVNAIEEEREREVPGMYSDKLLDSMGYYDPHLEEKDRKTALDSIYSYGPMGLELEDSIPLETVETSGYVRDTITAKETLDEFAAIHQAFFLAGSRNPEIKEQDTGREVLAVVNGEHTVRNHDRLELILQDSVRIGDVFLPRNSVLYGFVSLRKNRIDITIPGIGSKGLVLEAFDLHDGRKGIYVRNSFRAEMSKQVLDDLTEEINIAGVPQVRGLGNLFRRTSRNPKITVLNQYQLILKPQL